mmetsp:Transcript_75427/g.157270  ORF Transcript_75427/g.157270 Transcript_75427/m.157270 type:complete len:380 (-) Transcript_75427:342-1481(-)
MVAQIAQGEVLDHLQCHLGLVHWHHVASIEDLHKAETVAGTELGNSVALAVQFVVLVGGCVEIILVSPLQLLSPLHVAQPVADVVNITGVDQRLDAISEHVGDQGVVVAHPISCLDEEHVHGHVTGAPALGNTQLFLDRSSVQESLDHVEVVAEPAVLAGDAHVVGVPSSQFIGDLGHHVAGLVGQQAGRSVHSRRVAVAGFDASNACRHHKLHEHALPGVDDSSRRMATLCLSSCGAHLRIPLVLLLRVGETVANSQASQRDLDALASFVSAPDAMSDGRDIVACVGLTEDVEGLGSILRELLVEILQEGVHVVAHALFVVGTEASGETDPCWLVNPHDIGIHVPRVLVQGRALAILVHSARPVFSKESQLGRAAGST